MAFKKELLNRKITEAGITQVKLAELVGVDPRTVNRWLRGDKPPRNSYIRKLAKELHCRPEDFDPRYADGEDQIHIESRISAASHNAYSVMKLAYGVDEQAIIELAPVLFSIVAARAVNLPHREQEQYAELVRLAETCGLPRPHRFDNHVDAESFLIDEQAAQEGKCFGLEAEDQLQADPRNLFAEAMRRLIGEASSDVEMDQYFAPAGATPTALGFNPHIVLYNRIAEGNDEIVRRLTMGDVRLSRSITKAELNADHDLNAAVEIIRQDLAEQATKHRTKLAARREKELRRLEAWRASYHGNYPDQAKEYDDLVAAYCKPEGWYPDYFSVPDREENDASPFSETRFIDDDLLRARHDASGRGELWLSFNTPEAQRFRELEQHRRRSRKEFQEMDR
ncbi:hypothetical protein PK98_15645 [Croceibacterium mercuriale]|uniref:HTH cro/C1-type domain-containing protein n=1 Tax=Croceibacterium mercuriale TaxID=1572751 RepID=A0A0B2BRE5_9SPHN|nr:helix-turn-helix transcriptional regulator [Croceibacterium mercuriale]KHL24115.1 hypothetical protein PK98_15645 [Croceibacterium mercuriale]